MTVGLVVLQGALLALAGPGQVVDVAVKQVLLVVGLVALVALCPAGKPAHASLRSVFVLLYSAYIYVTPEGG